jgi:hypothetical protein
MFHVLLLLLSSFLLFVHACVISYATADNSYLAEALSKSFVPHVAFALHSTDLVWSLTWYDLENTLRPIGTFCPGTVTIMRRARTRTDVEFDAQLWPKPRKKRAWGSGKRAAKVGGKALAKAEPAAAAAAEEPCSDSDSGAESEGGGAEESDGSDKDDAFHDEIGRAADDSDFDEPPGGDALPPEPAPAPPLDFDDEPVLPPHALDLDAPDPDPLPGLPPLEPLPPLLAGRGKAEVTHYCVGGDISYYKKDKRFQASCRNPLHQTNKCVMTRNGFANKKADDPRHGGRCLGFLTAWLFLGCDAADKAEHWCEDNQDPNFWIRVEHREKLKESETGRRLLSFERPKIGDEESEPEQCP